MTLEGGASTAVNSQYSLHGRHRDCRIGYEIGWKLMHVAPVHDSHQQQSFLRAARVALWCSWC